MHLLTFLCVTSVFAVKKIMHLTGECMQYHAYIQEYTNIYQNLLVT